MRKQQKQFYSINIVAPPEYKHSEVFTEVALGLQGGFTDLGHNVPILRFPERQPQGKAIFLGANILPAFPKLQIPPNSIIYNLEIVTETSGWMHVAYLDLLQKHEVWDYSLNNIKKLSQYGVHNVKWCGVGYAKTLSCIEPLPESVDVLFYGSIFGRRVPILDAIESKGLRVQKLFGSYGAERDTWIAKSKIILNLHAYESNSVLEVVRCAYLWANKKTIVSEMSTEIPAGLNNGILLSHLEGLPALCQTVASDARLRTSVAAEGHEKFKAMRQSQYLKPLLTQ